MYSIFTYIGSNFTAAWRHTGHKIGTMINSPSLAYNYLFSTELGVCKSKTC